MEIISFFPSFVLDITNRCLLRDSEKVALRPKSFAILRYLVEHAHPLGNHGSAKIVHHFFPTGAAADRRH